MSPATLIASTRETVAFSQALIAQRHEFEDSQTAALDAIGEQIAQGVRGRPASAKVVCLHAQVMSDAFRNRLAHRAVVQADRRFAAEPITPTGFGEFA